MYSLMYIVYNYIDYKLSQKVKKVMKSYKGLIRSQIVTKGYLSSITTSLKVSIAHVFQILNSKIYNLRIIALINYFYKYPIKQSIAQILVSS